VPLSGKVLTGYGADLVLGGTLTHDTPLQDVNNLLQTQIYRTRWSGDFLPNVARNHGIEVHHPFWSAALIDFALAMPARHKLDPRDVKIALREVASSYLPEEIVWRKKIGIHQGSSVNSVFSRYLGLDTDHDYPIKDDFVYSVFKGLFEERKRLEEIDIGAIREQIQKPIKSTIYNTQKIKENPLKESLIDGVLVIEFDTNSRHNPFSKILERSLVDSLNRAEQNSDVRAVVVVRGNLSVLAVILTKSKR
jgi:hypothetical protein